MRWLFLVLLLTPSFANAEFKAGAYAINVNPQKFPISVNGGMSDRFVSKAHDPLHARCLVLDDGAQKLVLVVVDSCMIPRPIIDRAKKLIAGRTGIPPQQICISATHTHSAPTVAGVFQSDPDPDYVDYLPTRIAEGVEKAYERRVPAQIGWGVGSDNTQLFNRRWKLKPGMMPLNPFGTKDDKVKMNPGRANPALDAQAGPVDPEITILAVQDLAGKPIAVFANYGLHYVGGNPDLSADYFGAYAERLKALLQADEHFVGMMSNGASGDVNNVNFADPSPPKRMPGEQIAVVAGSVAQNTVKAYQKIAFRRDVKLGSALREVEFQVRKPNAEALQRAREILDQAKGKKGLATTAEIYARESVLLAKFPDAVKLNLQAHTIGDLTLTTIPCEVFAEIGLEIKKKNPGKKVCVISLANGYNGYLPTPAQHEMGGYETWRARSSYLEIGASPRIVETLQALIAEASK